MNLKFKTLGLALVAVLAMSAVAASGASAQVKHFEAPEIGANDFVTVTGEDTKGDDHPKFTIPGTASTTCNVTSYAGTAPKVATEITITPNYADCTTIGVPTTIDMNGCHYNFTLEPGFINGHTKGPVHVECPTGEEITITVGSICTIHIPAQTPTVPTVDFINQGSGNERDIEATVTVKGIAYTYTDHSIFCPNHAEVGHDGEFTGKTTIKGYKDTGQPHKHSNQQTAIRVIET